VAAHFVRYNQPDGFDALREETREFTEVAFATATPSIEPGDHLVLFNTPKKHLFAVVTVTGPGYRRDDDDSHHPFAVPVQPELVSDRGPEFKTHRVSAPSAPSTTPSSTPARRWSATTSGANSWATASAPSSCSTC